MRLSFHGAVGGVTGSCYLLECGGRRFLLECGLVQGGAEEAQGNRAPFPVPPEQLDAVVLSHAHLDHSGRVPLLVKEGFAGPVYAQQATAELCAILYRDAAYLQEKDAETESRKRARKGLGPVEPLFRTRDAERALSQLAPLPYGRVEEILPGVKLRFRDAGHILGSAIVELWLNDGQRERKLVFSGDLGQPNTPILRDPERVAEADLVLLESTYGDRRHRSREDTLAEMEQIFATAHAEGGNILVPAFAVGRTQELLYLFDKYFDRWGLEHWRICLDSPMAIQATELYARHVGLHDEEAVALWRGGGGGLAERLEFVRTPQQSRALNRVRSGLVIISASGMCEGGRVRHHLKNLAWRPDTHIVIAGFQARGTTGRQLVDGKEYISLWGESIRVAAQVHTVGGFSAHADQAALLEWYDGFTARPPVWLVHGEDEARAALARVMAETRSVRPQVPRLNDSIDLAKLAGS